jgi:hypothetical protein
MAASVSLSCPHLMIRWRGTVEHVEHEIGVRVGVCAQCQEPVCVPFSHGIELGPIQGLTFWSDRGRRRR